MKNETNNQCATCLHKTECENYKRLKHDDWLCGLYQKGHGVIQLSLLKGSQNG